MKNTFRKNVSKLKIKGGKSPDKKICKFNIKCKRKDCWFNHPNGRRIDKNVKNNDIKICRYGRKCNRTDCWFNHPDGRKIDNEEKDDEEKDYDELFPNWRDTVVKPEKTCNHTFMLDGKYRVSTSSGLEEERELMNRVVDSNGYYLYKDNEQSSN